MITLLIDDSRWRIGDSLELLDSLLKLRTIALVALCSVVATVVVTPSTGSAGCGAGLGKSRWVGGGHDGGGSGNGGNGGGGGSAEPSRFYWRHVIPPETGDPTSLLCPISDTEVGVEYWEELIDRATGESLVTRTRCVPLTAPEPEPTPDPPSPASIWDAVPVPAPSVSVNPAGEGVTGLETWLWLEGTTTLDVGPLSLDGWSVTATAEIERIVWNMGDGGSTSAARAGGPFDPAASYTYETKSGDQPYTLGVTTRWHGIATISGYGVNLTEDLGTVTTTGSRPYDVDEIRSVLIE